MRYAALTCLLLSACGGWPDAGGPPITRDARPWPALLPLEQVLDAAPIADDPDSDRLAARAANLRARAAILRRDASDVDAMEALRARLAP